MKLSNVIMGIGVIALMSACSNDEPTKGGPTEQPGNRTFLQVNITSNDSRDGEYEYGSALEHNVTDAQFFFFDENGIYVGKAQKWEDQGAGTTENIEWIGKNVIVLDNQESNTYPTWVMTVLNAPDFSIPARATLAQASRELRNWENTIQGTDYFVMSTTSFYGKPAGDPTHYDDETTEAGETYFVTRLTENDFIKYDPNVGRPEADDVADANVVDIYVERLAAKVELTFAAEDGSNLVETLSDGSQIFKTDVTLMGEVNDGEGLEGGVAATPVFVKVFGWDLSATAPMSYLSKQLKSEWKSAAPWATWNHTDWFRSYWAQSTVYEEAEPVLNHKNYNELSLSLTNTAAANARPTNVAYCNENTNTAENIIVNNLPVAGKTTSALIKAQLCVKNAAGEYVGINAIKYNGSLFTYDRYKAYVLDQVNRGNGYLNLWTKNADGSYSQIGTESVKFQLATSVLADNALSAIFTNHSDLTGTGKILVVADLDAATTYYEKTGETDELGNPVFEPIADAATTLNTLLAAQQKVAAEAFGGEGTGAGAMYYAIPVEHETTVDNTETGYYGVVRNHWYRLTVSNIIKVGHGVFDPDNEDIIPDEPENPRYFVAARINILSWKVVKQNNIIL